MNIQLLRDAFAWAAKEDELGEDSAWDQNEWINDQSCGTRMCIAGWVAHSAGVPLHWSASPYTNETYAAHVAVNDKLVSIHDYATKALGLTEYWANELFLGVETDLDELEDVCMKIAADYGEEW